MRIGLAQTRQTDDFDANVEAVFRYLAMAAAEGVQIVCFPETQTVGYRVDIAPTNAPVPTLELERVHGEVAARCGELGIACILGTETPSPREKPYNTALIIDSDGEILGTHHKAKLTPLDLLAYTPGESFETFELFGVRVGVVICFEGFRFAETTAECVRQGAQLVFQPQNNTTRPNDWKTPIHHAMITTRAAENTVWFASCNACLPPHQNCRSLVIAPDGRLHAQTELKRQELLATEIDLDLATRAMFQFDMGGCAEVLYSDTVQPEECASIMAAKGAGDSS